MARASSAQPQVWQQCGRPCMVSMIDTSRMRPIAQTRGSADRSSTSISPVAQLAMHNWARDADASALASAHQTRVSSLSARLGSSSANGAAAIPKPLRCLRCRSSVLHVMADDAGVKSMLEYNMALSTEGSAVRRSSSAWAPYQETTRLIGRQQRRGRHASSSPATRSPRSYSLLCRQLAAGVNAPKAPERGLWRHPASQLRGEQGSTGVPPHADTKRHAGQCTPPLARAAVLPHSSTGVVHLAQR